MKAFAVAAVVVGMGIGLSAQRQTPVYKAGDPGVKNPVVVKEKKPTYTAAAMRQKIQGSVELETIIDTSGKPTAITIVRSLDPVYGLDANAVAALQAWEFKPALRDGRPVPMLVTVVLTFTLRDGPVFDKTHADVTPPVILFERKPSYTAEAMRAGIEGAVEVEGTVGTDGKVSDARVVKALSADLDARAIEAFKASTFKPATRNGRAVAYRVTVLFTFNLRN
ncbi:MAG: energy transducer TonB [Vicinamibacterales bacterium]